MHTAFYVINKKADMSRGLKLRTDGFFSDTQLDSFKISDRSDSSSDTTTTEICKCSKAMITALRDRDRLMLIELNAISGS